MNWLDRFSATESSLAQSGHIYGVVIAIVTNNQDPQGLGRVKLKFPWLSDADESNWARVATLMAGDDRGSYFLPEVNDEVLVAFEQGNVEFPYVLGALWNGKDKPPVQNEDGKNDVRLLKSRSGHLVKLDDTPEKEMIEIVDRTGKNLLRFESSRNRITIESQQDIVLSAQNAIKLDAATVEIAARQKVEVKAVSGIDVKANGVTNIKGAIINLN